MLGFDAIGRLAIAQLPATLSYVLLAGAGSYSVAGSSATFALSEATTGATYSFTGSAATFNTQLNSAAASYSLTGGAITARFNMQASGTSYALTGNAVSFGVGWPAQGGTYAVAGNAATFALNWNLISIAGADPSKFYSGGIDILAVGSRVGPRSVPPAYGVFGVTGYDAHFYRDFVNWIAQNEPGPGWSAMGVPTVTRADDSVFFSGALDILAVGARRGELPSSWQNKPQSSSIWTHDDAMTISPPVIN